MAYDIETDLKVHGITLAYFEWNGARKLFFNPIHMEWKVTKNIGGLGGRVETIYRGDNLQVAMTWLIWGHEGAGSEQYPPTLLKGME